MPREDERCFARDFQRRLAGLAMTIHIRSDRVFAKPPRRGRRRSMQKMSAGESATQWYGAQSRRITLSEFMSEGQLAELMLILQEIHFQ